MENKIDQLAIKYTNLFHCKTLKIYPNWDFGFENMPSGNPAKQIESFLSGTQLKGEMKI
jgi:hypothetical protein